MHRLGHNPFDGGVIFRIVKELVSCVAAIKGVINYAAGPCARVAHEVIHNDLIDLAKKKLCILLSSPRDDQMKVVTGLARSE